MFATGLGLFVLAYVINCYRDARKTPSYFEIVCCLGGVVLMLVSLGILAWRYLP